MTYPNSPAYTSSDGELSLPIVRLVISYPLPLKFPANGYFIVPTGTHSTPVRSIGCANSIYFPS